MKRKAKRKASNRLEKLKQLEIQVNRREVLEKLINQFKVKESWWREGIQNSKGALATRVDISFDYDKDTRALEMVIEDDGEGMNERDRENFLLKLFSSSKEFDLDKPGRFGIGVVSAFAYGPDEFEIESSKDGHHWRIVIDGEDYGLKLYRNNPRAGTRITLHKRDVSQRMAETLEQEALEAVIKDCSHMEFPIYFQGEQVNRPFELEDAACQIQFKDGLTEAVLGLTTRPLTRYYNNRIRLQDKSEFLISFKGSDYGISVLLNSKYLSFNLSRNDIIRDDKYQEIRERAKSHLNDLVVKAFHNLNELGTDLENPQDAQRVRILWNFILNYINNCLGEYDSEKRREKKAIKRFFTRRKKREDYIPKEIMELPLFSTWEGRRVSLEEVLAHAKREGKIFTARRKSKVLETLTEQGKLVLCPTYLSSTIKAGKSNPTSQVNPRDYSFKFLEKFGTPDDVEHIFYMPMVLSDSELEETEVEFLKMARANLKGSALSKEYDELVFGDFSQEWGEDKDKPFMHLADSITTRTYGRRPLFTEEGKKTYKKRFRGRKTMVLNKNTPYIQKIVELSTTPKRDFAMYFLFQALAVPSTYYDPTSELHLDLYREFMGTME